MEDYKIVLDKGSLPGALFRLYARILCHELDLNDIRKKEISSYWYLDTFSIKKIYEADTHLLHKVMFLVYHIVCSESIRSISPTCGADGIRYTWLT